MKFRFLQFTLAVVSFAFWLQPGAQADPSNFNSDYLVEAEFGQERTYSSDRLLNSFPIPIPSRFGQVLSADGKPIVTFNETLTPEYPAARTVVSDEYFEALWRELSRLVAKPGPLYQARLRRIPKEVYLKHVYSPLYPGGFIVPWQTEELWIELDSYVIKIGPDAGVLEMTASPISKREFNRRRPLFLQLDKALARVGLEPMDFAGGGHVHLGLRAFQRDAVAFRNFMVTLFKESAWAMGGLSWDPHNAIHPAQLSSEQQQAFLDVIHDFDSGRMPQTIRALSLALQTRFFAMPGRVDFLRINREEKYYAFSLNYNFASHLEQNEWVYVPKGDIEETGTIELRGIRPQKTVDTLDSQFGFIESILQESLKNSRLGIRVAATKPVAVFKPQLILSEFRESVVKRGHRWQDFREMVLPNWQIAGGELERFEAGLLPQLAVNFLRASALQLPSNCADAMSFH